MKNQTRETAFNEQVAARLKSADWDIQIAGNVLRRRRKRNYTFAAVGSAASLAMAASLIFAILPGMLGGTSDGARLNQFVNAQVEGTWKKVFTESALPDDSKTVLVEYQDDTDTDELIDETLAQRF
jgi:hypothetical protein